MAAKLKNEDTRPFGSGDTWARTNGTYIAGRSYIDGADETAAQMESKWGCDRLRLLVSPELRERFDRQRYLFNQAIWHGDLESVRRESGRMVNAWTVLDRAAESAGALKLSREVWEVALEDGSVAAIVPDDAHAHAVIAEGRKLAIYTLAEIGRLLSHYPEVAKAKQIWPGTEVTEVRRSVSDPLGAIWDTNEDLNDPISDVGAA